MNSVPISPGLHALLNAAASDAISSPLPSASHSHSSGYASHSSPLLSSISTSSHFLSALHLRSPPSTASSPSSAAAGTVTGMSILKMPPAVTSTSPSPTAASASASTVSSPSPSSHPDSPEQQEGDVDSSLPSSSPGAPDAPDAPDSPLSSLASASSAHSSTPSAQLQSAFFPSPPTAPTSLSYGLHAPHVSHSPLTSLLQPHSSTLQVRRNSTGGSGITKLLSTFKRTAKATTTLTSASSSSLFKKKLTAASSLTSSSSAASSDSAGGSSCHQCKSRRNYGDLSYCSSSLNKKNKNAVCRKKYCEHCLKKFYRESPITANGQVWKCPSCRKICCCAACRRREMRGSGGANGASGANGNGIAGEATAGEMDGQNVGMDTPPSNALSPVHSAVQHEQQQHKQQQQQQQDVEMSPVDQSPSPPQSAFRGLLLSPHTPSLPPLPASALSSREKERAESREAKDESLPIRDIHRTLLTVANSPALTALSAAASTLNGGSYSIKKEKGSGLLDGGSMGGGAGAGRYAGLMTASLSRGLGVGGLNGHSLLNGHSNGHRNGRRRAAFPDLNGHDSSTSSPSSTDDSDDDTADAEAESSTVGDKDDDATRSGHTNGGTDSTLSTFALFYSIGQMGAVQEGVRDVMKRSEGSNAQKLKEIEGIFVQVAEKISAEEVPLQL